MGGTSGAAAIVAGAASLVEQRNPNLSFWPEAMRAVLMAGANSDVDRTAGDAKDGAGSLSAIEAVAVAEYDFCDTSVPDADLDLFIDQALGGGYYEHLAYSTSWDSVNERLVWTNADSEQTRYLQLRVRLWDSNAQWTWFGIAWTAVPDDVSPGLMFEEPQFVPEHPEVTIEPVPGVDPPTQIRIRGTATDVQTGVQIVKLYGPTGLLGEVAGENFDWTEPLSDQGTKAYTYNEFLVEATDLVGNTTSQPLVIKIPSAHPERRFLTVRFNPRSSESQRQAALDMVSGAEVRRASDMSTVKLPQSTDARAAAQTLMQQEGVVSYAFGESRGSSQTLPPDPSVFKFRQTEKMWVAPWYLDNGPPNKFATWLWHYPSVKCVGEGLACGLVCLTNADCLEGQLCWENSCECTGGFECRQDSGEPDKTCQCPGNMACGPVQGQEEPQCLCYSPDSCPANAYGDECLLYSGTFDHRCGYSGAEGADIAWKEPSTYQKIRQIEANGHEIVFAVVDNIGAFDTTMPDIADRVWVNALECCGAENDASCPHDGLAPICEPAEVGDRTADNNGALTLEDESFRVHLPEIGDPHHAVACDVNDDGLLDIVEAVNRMGDEARDRLLIQHVDPATGDWWFDDEAEAWGLPFQAYGWSHDVACADLVGSSLPDLVIARRGPQKSWLFENEGNTFVDRTNLLPDVEPNTQGVSVCELNGAGKPEILFANGDVMLWTRESNAVLTYDAGQGKFVDVSDTLGFNFSALPSLTETMECGDVNGDGFIDVMVVNIGLRKWLYLGHGTP